MMTNPVCCYDGLLQECDTSYGSTLDVTVIEEQCVLHPGASKFKLKPSMDSYYYLRSMPYK